MTAYERFINRLHGQTVDRPPNFDIMMTFAAHFIGQPLSKYYLDHQVLVNANLAVYEAFHLDIVQVISDPYREASDLGVSIEFPPDGLPVARVPLIAEPTDLKRLKPVKPEQGQRMSDRLQAITLLKQKVGGEVPILGWVEGALAAAATFRGVHHLLMDMIDRPEWVHELLEILVQVEIEFAKAQIEAGADIIGLGDAIASQISPSMYETFAWPYEKQIFQAVKAMGAIARLHICGNTSAIVSQMAATGADIVDLDWMVDFGKAAAICNDDPVLCGNFDPVTIMLQGIPPQVRAATLTCLRTGGKRCISMAGCEIPDGTPPENLLAQANALKEFGATVV